MQEKELEIAGGSLHYEIRDGKIAVTGLGGGASQVSVPERIENLPVEIIHKRAFLSKKNLRKVILPDTIREVGDWAFAYCDSLREIALPRSSISFGRSAFLECGNLKEISPRGAGREISLLLAAAVTSLEAYYLLDISEAGSGEWLDKWDQKLFSLLYSPDAEGYAKQVLCGEEDYGSTDFEAFLREKRKKKVRLCTLRLLCPTGLSDERREKLERYLAEHTKGCESDETWQVVLLEHGSDREYYSLFAQLGCLTEENFQAVVADIGEDKPEMKAYFMRWKEEKLGYGDFFEGLEL